MGAIVTATFPEWLRHKAAGCQDIGDSTDFGHAADVINEMIEALGAARLWIGIQEHQSPELGLVIDRALAKARGEQ